MSTDAAMPDPSDDEPERVHGQGVDPLGDGEAQAAAGRKRNYAKVGSGRPSSLLYTYGPGAIMDLPQFTIMPAGFDDWDRIWDRWQGDLPVVHAPRLRTAVRTLMRSRDLQLRPFPWQPKSSMFSKEGDDLGVSARVFPQWMRCTGCNALMPLSRFEYQNTHPFRTDEACFEHVGCGGRSTSASTSSSTKRRSTAVPARYLLACTDGHLDEFPYGLWVHHGGTCPQADVPALEMVDRVAGKGAAATIVCRSCDVRRPMNEAQGEGGRSKLPRCRGRHPHLDSYDVEGCPNDTHLMLVGASNLWFAATQSIVVMPESEAESADVLADAVRLALGGKLLKYQNQVEVIRDLLDGTVDVTLLSDDELSAVLATAAAPPPPAEELEAKARDFDPVDLLVPEWNYLQRDPRGPRHEDPTSGLTLSARSRSPHLPLEVTRVLAVERLRKVNALLGFTRIDEMDRVGDLPRRLAPLARAKRPAWTVATEDRGEGVYLQLDEERVAQWEQRVRASPMWEAHRDAHRRNFRRRMSETAAEVHPDTRLRPPRYWLVHTLAHVLIREAAMTCGYSAASLSERLYAWEESATRPPAAGLLVITTASDSDGTLGGLVQLSQPERLAALVAGALRRAERCSSDPVCAMRTPKDPEDFLHGAACHCCAMASETSCERSNRFLDRRFLLDLPGSSFGFFSGVS